MKYKDTSGDFYKFIKEEYTYMDFLKDNAGHVYNTNTWEYYLEIALRSFTDHLTDGKTTMGVRG